MVDDPNRQQRDPGAPAPSSGTGEAAAWWRAWPARRAVAAILLVLVLAALALVWSAWR